MEQSRYGEIYGGTTKNYNPPRHFKLSELKAQQRDEAMRQFKATGGVGGELELDQAQQRGLRPQSVSIY
jgi:hypothetical protein